MNDGAKSSMDNPPAVYEAISAVMGDLSKRGIAKAQKNQQQGYAFRGIDDVYNALSGLLSAHKLVMLPRVLGREVTERQTKNGTALFYVVLDVEYDLVSAVDGSIHTVRVAGEAMDAGGDKATNKAFASAYKYGCFQIFCIPTEGDNDADKTTHEVAAAPDVPEDVKLALEEAEDYEAFKEVWRGLTKETRQLIATHHADWAKGLKDALAGA